MNFIKTTILALVLISPLQSIKAQTLNWSSIEDSKHILNIGLGWDYSMSYNIGYAHRLPTRAPLLLHANFSIPSGENLLDDFKTKLGAQIVLLNKSSLKGSITLNGIYRRTENTLVRLQNFGSELKGAFGHYRPNWFLAAEISFDKAIVTHFKHSNLFKANAYQGVKDGWYDPAAGGNVSYGLQTGYSFGKSDVTLNLGMVKTEDFKSNPLIPFYLMFGYNFRIN
ncbi:MAG: hypothetical protein ACQUHE_11185 [Bacteroidia bacterium]